MTVSKSQIPEAIQGEIQFAQAYIAAHPQAGPNNGMVPCVYVQQVSARRYDVGWRHTKAGTVVGEVQTDCHPAYNKDQVIAWVWPLSQEEKAAAILERWPAEIEVIYLGEQTTFTRRGGVGDYPYECPAKDKYPDAVIYFNSSGGWIDNYQLKEIRPDLYKFIL